MLERSSHQSLTIRLCARLSSLGTKPPNNWEICEDVCIQLHQLSTTPMPEWRLSNSRLVRGNGSLRRLSYRTLSHRRLSYRKASYTLLSYRSSRRRLSRERLSHGDFNMGDFPVIGYPTASGLSYKSFLRPVESLGVLLVYLTFVPMGGRGTS